MFFYLSCKEIFMKTIFRYIIKNHTGTINEIIVCLSRPRLYNVAEVQGPVAEVQGPVAEVHRPVAVVHRPVAEVHGRAAKAQGPVAEVQGPVA